MKKKVLFFVVVLLFVVLLAGCAGGSSKVLNSNRLDAENSQKIEEETTRINGVAGVLIPDPKTYIIIDHNYQDDKQALTQYVIHLPNEYGYVRYILDRSKEEGAYVEINRRWFIKSDQTRTSEIQSVTFHLDSLKRIGSIEIPNIMDIGRPKIAK